jgi:uncharacterized protein (TIGR02271 family)
VRQELRIPVVREEVRVGKREVERGRVRVRKVHGERQEQVDLPLVRQEVEIQRVPVNRPVAGPVAAREEEDGTVVLSVVEEVLEVHKSWVLREEIRLRRKTVRTRRPVTVTLRTEDVVVEHEEPDPPESAPGRAGQGRRGPQR